MNRKGKWIRGVAGLAAGLVCAATAGGAEEQFSPAELSLRGFGVFKNLELRNALELLLDEGEAREFFDSSFIEDAALVLNSELVEQGFFAAEVEAVWRDAEGTEARARLDASLSEAMPRQVRARELRLIARPGVRAVVEAVEFEGLSVIEEADARRFFLPDSGLFTPEAVRAWSESSARGGAAKLTEALQAMGHAEATARVADTRLDRESGRVELRVEVMEGPMWRVAEVNVRAGDESLESPETELALVGEPWTRSRSLDAGQVLRRRFQALGFPDVRVEWKATPGDVSEARERPVAVVARVETGPRVRVGEVGFAGAVRTRPEVLERRARNLKPGDWFDPTEVEAARLRLARLGVFRRVEAREDDVAGTDRRAVVFELREEAAWEAAWMLGYGSYEQARVGLEVTRNNLWGLAHRTRFEAVQSLKGTRADYRYTVPTFFDDTVEATGRVFGLRREEQSFDRVEYGAAVEARREVPWIRAMGTGGFTYEVLRAEDVALGTTATEVDDATVASFDLGLTRDKRDNPIRPRAGWRWAAQSQFALPELGSEVRYEKLELAWAWHRALGDERWVHVGVSQGLLFSGDEEVPLNKLFFPGGESSIRGYQQGEATQRDAAGRFVGVRSSWLVNLEFEQLVTGRWTAVVFIDALGTAVDANEWPGDETLASAGVGARYQSPIGPLRLEYGRNLNPRVGDTSGTLHFSIGFPF